jgi:hypothetical protein
LHPPEGAATRKERLYIYLSRGEREALEAFARRMSLPLAEAASKIIVSYLSGVNILTEYLHADKAGGEGGPRGLRGVHGAA